MNDCINSLLTPTAQQVKEQYNNPASAARYAGLYQTFAGKRRHQREEHCIAKGLAGVPENSWVLDLPCGAGRMYPLLKGLGFRVVEADASPYMIDYAQQKAQLFSHNTEDEFRIVDVFSTPFEKDRFDAAVCNRLLHHFPSSALRQQALRELARITAGPIVVSFFSSAATDALKYTLKYALKERSSPPRKPISPLQFAQDVRESGLKISRWIVPLPGFSMQWYVVLCRR